MHVRVGVIPPPTKTPRHHLRIIFSILLPGREGLHDLSVDAAMCYTEVKDVSPVALTIFTAISKTCHKQTQHTFRFRFNRNFCLSVYRPLIQVHRLSKWQP